MGKKSSKPSGLTISRNGNTFSCGWSIPSHGYGDGQKFACSVSPEASIGKKTKAKAFEVILANYYPNGGVLPYVWFAVKGNRDKKKGDKWTWSDWAYGYFYLFAPPAPTNAAELTNSNTTKFSGSLSVNDNQPFHSILMQTAFTSEENAPVYGSEQVFYGTSWERSFTESDVSTGSHTRWVRVYARGAGGASGWVESSHVYAKPKRVNVDSVKVTNNGTGGYDVSVYWLAYPSRAYPIDSISVEYAITTPTANMEFPSGASWTEAKTLTAVSAKAGTSFSTNDICGEDECLFIRINAKHDNDTTEGVATLAKTGKMKAPTLTTFTTNPEDYKATVNFTKNTSINAPTVVYYKTAAPDSQALAIGVATSGNSVVVQCPDWSGEDEIFFGVQSVLGTIANETRSDGVTIYNVDPTMESDIDWSTGAIVGKPTSITAVKTAVEGSARVSWAWSWAKANSAELSWADHIDAWESTDEPETFMISNMHAASWIVAGLSSGKDWYFRVRLVVEDGDSRIYSPYSDIATLSLTTAPNIPMLSLSDAIITIGAEITASWDYENADGTPQVQAEVAEIVDGEYIPISDLETQTYVDIDTAELGWMTAGLHYISVRVKSESGLLSDWSEPAAVSVANPITCEITSTSLEEVTVIIDDETQETETRLSLTDLPLSISVTGADYSGTTTVFIERAEDFFVTRPDDTDWGGYKGETVVLKKQLADTACSIDKADLIGALDDSAKYRLTAIVEDIVGQTATDSLEFEVHWEHQAIMPEVEISTDSTELVTFITPIAPEGADASDKCDIYRLSADRPELIYEDAKFGTVYVDPHPAFGEHGGHRIVFKTKNGDYITDDSVIAFYDTDRETDGDYLEPSNAVIEFNSDRVELSHNIEMSTSWDKDFQETKYLGGATQGDWGKTISRKSSVSGVAVTLLESEMIEAMRRLSLFNGICHVRTPDGSSYSADVQVTEKTSSSNGGKIANFSLSITRVDQQSLDGMTYAEWIGEETE